MIIRIVRLHFRPEATEAFLAIFRESKSKIRQFPGCRHLELWQDLDNPAVYCTHSHWESEADLEAYRHSELFNGVWSATRALFAERPLAFSVQKTEE